MTRILALYPAAIVVLLISLPILEPRTGPLALANILSVHLALAAVVLVPVAMVRPGVALRSSLVVLGLVIALRFSGEWLSLPPSVGGSDDLFMAASWNLGLGARAGDAAVEGIKTLDVDVVTSRSWDRTTLVRSASPSASSSAIRTRRSIWTRRCSAWACSRAGRSCGRSSTRVHH